MTTLRTITCDVCGLMYTEVEAGAGFPGWGALTGIVFDEHTTSPELCPAHLAKAAEFIHRLRDEERSA